MLGSVVEYHNAILRVDNRRQSVVCGILLSSLDIAPHYHTIYEMKDNIFVYPTILSKTSLGLFFKKCEF